MKDIAIEENLCEFIKDFVDDLGSLELLLFFGRHPLARFNQAAIVHALSAKRFDTARALKHLINKGLVITCAENGTTLYSLTKEDSLRNLVLSLMNIDHHQWRLIVEQILQSDL